jgi:putative peptidoglycan lipid II flippase
VRDAVSATGFNLVGKSAGYLVPFFIASWFGVSPATDAFFFSYGIVLFLAGAFSPLMEIIVPHAAELRRDGGDLSGFMNRLLGTSTVILGLGLTAFLLLGLPCIPLVTRFDSETSVLTVRLLLEFAPVVMLLFWTTLLSGYLNSVRQFALPALAPGVRAAINLGFVYLLKDRFGVHALVLGYLLGECVRVALLAISIARTVPFRFRPSFRQDRRLRTFYQTAFHATVSMVWVLLNQVVDSSMASWLGSGSVTVLQYAGNLYNIPANLFSGGILTVLLAHWSEHYTGTGDIVFRDELRRDIRNIFWLALPVGAAFILLSRPLSRLLLGHGAFDITRSNLVASVWSAYLIGFPFQVLAQLYIKGLLVLRQTKTLIWGAFYSVFLNVLGNLVFMHWLGETGIALATSCTTVFSAWYFRRSLKSAFAIMGSGAGAGNCDAKS